MAFDVGDDLRLHFVKRLNFFLERNKNVAGFTLGLFNLGELDDVITKIRLNRAAYIANLHGKRRVFKGLDHRAFAEKSQVAALPRRAGVLRIFFRQIGKIVGLCLDFF